MYLETYVTDIIEGKRKAFWAKGILYILSCMMKLGVKVRHFAFDCALVKEKKVGVPVVSIGNIVAGGTGKTALVEKLGKELAAKGKLAILSRGYRGKLEHKTAELHLLDSSFITPKWCGDEPYLLLKALPEAALFVGKNRVANAERAAYQSTDLILLDDGMQYRQLHRDLEIVMLNAANLYGKGFFLPRGYLRDFPERLERADYLFAHGLVDVDHYHRVKKKLIQYTEAPLIGTRMEPKKVELSSKEEWFTLDGKKVGVFCGLGNPETFVETVRRFGGEVLEQWSLPDHVEPKMEALRRFALFCRGKQCDLILCSEKDWIKIKSALPSLALPVGWLKAEMEVIMGQKIYEQLIQELESYLQHKEVM